MEITEINGRLQHRNGKKRVSVERELRNRLRQQAAITELGEQALSGVDLSRLMDLAVASLAENLDVEYAKVLELQPDGETLLLKHGVGWKLGAVGHAEVMAGENSQAGYTLLSNHPVIVEDLPQEQRFSGPPLLTDHNVVSGLSVIIHGPEEPYGILGAHTIQRRRFTEHDVHFLQAIANILGETIARDHALDELRRQAQILKQIHDAVVATDMDGFVTMWNKGAESIFGYSKEEALGRHISFVYSEDQYDFLQKKVIEPLQRNGEHKIEVRMTRKSGRPFYAHLSLSLLRDAVNKPVGMIGYSIDISERKLMVAQFHELGRIAGSISSAVQALKNGGWAEEEFRDELLSGMGIVTDEMKRLLDDLATLDARASGTLRIERQPIDVKEWLLQTLAFWKDTAHLKGLSFELDLQPALPMLHADPFRLEQVLGNLLSNAIKFSPAGGKVSVHCGTEGNELWIRVSDNGPGIPLDEQEHIFMPFYRLGSPTGHIEGKGLGLTIVRDLVKAHHGRVQLTSAPGEGSSFTIWLSLNGEGNKDPVDPEV